jgi:hypothetical protein
MPALVKPRKKREVKEEAKVVKSYMPRDEELV